MSEVIEDEWAERRQLGEYTLWLLVGVCVIGSNAFLMSPVLADIARALNASAAEVARAVAAYGGATAFSGIFLTRYASSSGSQRALTVSGLALATGIAATGFASHWMALTLAQGMAGLGAGVMLPTIYSLTSYIAPRGRESVVLGRVITGWSLAMVAAVPASSLMAELWGWRSAYLIVAAVAAIAVLGLRRLPPYENPQDGGTVTLVQALCVPRAALVLSVCFLYMVAFYGVYTFLGDYLQRSLGVSPSGAGLAVLTYGMGFGAASVAGGLIDRIGAQTTVKLALATIACVYLVLLASSAAFTAMLAACLLWGFVNHLGLNSLVSALSALDERARVRLLGLFSAVSYGGTMMAGIVFGLLYDRLGFEALLACAAILCALSSIGFTGMLRGTGRSGSR